MISDTGREELRRSRWQQALRPFLIVVVAATGLFFFAASAVQFQRIADTIVARSDTPPLAAALTRYEAGPQTAADLDYLKWQSLARLDDRAQRSRLDRSAAALLVNVWTRYLGFVTGMVLAITGAAFIMARLSETATALEAKGAVAAATLKTSSPGIVLAVLGTALMLMAMSISFSESGEEPTLSAAADAAVPEPAVQRFLPKSVARAPAPASGPAIPGP